MRKTIVTFLMLVLAISTYGQTKERKSKFNLDFESVESGFPIVWNKYASTEYLRCLDSATVQSGKYSVSIEYKEGTPNFMAWACILPDNYAGRKITLSGYIKTENVSDGYAGLWMRIDPSIAFDNMQDRGIKGTTDWTQYTITLTMDPNRTKRIVIGGLLVGKGKMWMDNLEVTIDGKDIRKLKPLITNEFPADRDNEFDKGSLITIIPTDRDHIETLKDLGLIWGFLKYYHPNIAKGDFNWDYALFRVLPNVLNSENVKDFDAIMVKWISDLGPFVEGKEMEEKSSEVKLRPDLDWVSHSGFSEELTTLLLKVKNAKRPRDNYYVGLQAPVNNPEFKNEDSYSTKYPDAGFRLLTLYRYWNIIQYYFPYKSLIGEDWKNVLEEFIPKLINTNNVTEYELAVLELIGRVHDTHANIWGGGQAASDYFGLKYAPVELTFVENKPVVTGFFDDKKGKESGLEIGDIITTINKRSIDEILEENLKYTPASNYPTQLRDIALNLFKTNDSIINVEFLRNDVKGSTVLKAFSGKDLNIYRKYHNNDTCFKLITKDIAYINNGGMQKKYLPKIWNEIKNTKGLIIDCRNYPSDFIIYELSRYLMPKSTPFVKVTNGNIKSPGLFTYTRTLKAGMKNKGYYKGKVVIIVNEFTQSSAEFHSMAYRVNPNATFIGSTTAGADGNVSQFYLPGGISTMISGVGVYYPDGRDTQRVGIVPDIEVKPTIEGIKKGQDEPLEKAIEIINGSNKSGL